MSCDTLKKITKIMKLNTGQCSKRQDSNISLNSEINHAYEKTTLLVPIRVLNNMRYVKIGCWFCPNVHWYTTNYLCRRTQNKIK